MKKITFLLAIILSSICFSNAQSTVNLEDMLAEINTDSLRETVLDLQNFGSRFALREGGNLEVAEYIAQRLNNYGVAAAVDSFYQTGNHWLGGHFEQYFYNVKGILEAPHPVDDSIVIIGGHLDAISYNVAYQLLNYAPGADDNASGVAVMIEIARIFHLRNFVPNRSIHFMGYDGEELGLFGGYADALKRNEANEKVAVMLNNDMVSFQPDDDWKLTLHWYDNAIDLVQRAAEICSQYTDIEPFIPTEEENSSARSSDSYAYYQYGFRPVFAIEHTFSTSYHTDHDVVDSNNYLYHAHVTRYNLAMLYHFAFCSSGSSISEINASVAARFFPNPLREKAILQFSLNESAPVTLTFNNKNKKIVKTLSLGTFSAGSNILEISLENLAPGLYIGRLSTANECATIKVMKN
ncbi:MAG: M20/M25/M40 family metallo-hydrolase [Bacteroidales bacterium]|nr:M20/M25/M40 family metallo-hydrolase [Bacteroidales bacterium]